MPRKIRRKKRRQRGGESNIGENNANALKAISSKENNQNALLRTQTGENNLRAIEILQAPKPSIQAPGNLAQINPILKPADLPRPIRPDDYLVPPKPKPAPKQNPGFFGKVNNFLKRTKIVSRSARAIGNFTNSGTVHRIADIAQMHGYGRKKRRQRGSGPPALRDKYGAYLPLIKS